MTRATVVGEQRFRCLLYLAALSLLAGASLQPATTWAAPVGQDGQKQSGDEGKKAQAAGKEGETASSVEVPSGGGQIFFEKANVYGVTTFMEANEGYYEFGYAYVDGRDKLRLTEGIEIGNFDRDFHSITGAFSHRFGRTLSNSIRVVAAVGQKARQNIDPSMCGRGGGIVDPIQCMERTANGVILLVENAFITSRPYTFIPYFNGFVGYDKPQSLMHDPAAGGILKNTGLAFEADALSGFPALDSSGHDAYGAAFGLQWLFGLDKQLVVEVAGQNTYNNPFVVGGPEHGQARGAEAAVAFRYQMPLAAHFGLILRLDGIYGYRAEQENVAGGKLELRMKF